MTIEARQVACCTIGCCLLALLAVRPAAQQQPPQPPPTFRSSVDVVRVEASVLGKDRRPIRGLAAADFTVRENGEDRPIVVFAPVELPAPGRDDRSTTSGIACLTIAGCGLSIAWSICSTPL